VWIGSKDKSRASVRAAASLRQLGRFNPTYPGPAKPCLPTPDANAAWRPLNDRI